MATTLAWSTHPQKLVTFLGRACAPHGAFVAYDRHGTERERERESERERERERETSWSHFWGKFLGRYGNTQIHLLHMIWYTIHMMQMIRTHKIVGHIFGTNSWADVGIRKYICYI